MSDKNTIVIPTSDNGGERFFDNWPFSGRKAELLEGGIRVPAVVRWSGRIPAGRTTAQVASSRVWMPKFLKLASVALSPFLLAAAPRVSRKLFSRHRYNAQRAMRDGDMKLLSINGNTFLFNPATHARMEKAVRGVEPVDAPRRPVAYTYGFPPDERANRYKNQ